MKPEDAALEAAKLVGGDRGDSYGDPWEDFGRTCELFFLRTGIRLKRSEATTLMECVKDSREVNEHKRDNLVDGIGYASITAYLKAREWDGGAK